MLYCSILYLRMYQMKFFACNIFVRLCYVSDFMFVEKLSFWYYSFSSFLDHLIIYCCWLVWVYDIPPSVLIYCVYFPLIYTRCINHFEVTIFATNALLLLNHLLTTVYYAPNFIGDQLKSSFCICMCD